MSPHGERRRHPRSTPFEWQGGIRGRIRPGHDVLVIDLAESGVLVETSRRLTPGATAEIQIDAPDGRHTTRGVVVRSYVCALLADLLLFRSALVFESPVPWLREEALVRAGVAAGHAGTPCPDARITDQPSLHELVRFAAIP